MVDLDLLKNENSTNNLNTLMKLISSDNMKNVHFLHGFQHGFFPSLVSRRIDRARVQNATNLI